MDKKYMVIPNSHGSGFRIVKASEDKRRHYHKGIESTHHISFRSLEREEVDNTIREYDMVYRRLQRCIEEINHDMAM